ncbi:MAG: hypothetical protein E7011_05155 [Alphaproteobacteria bacterium]|nr:hypothetical protein [Alphaproteobacteria bacterium]
MNYKLWDNAINPIGIVQIIHNRNKTPGHYDNIAQFLNKNRFLVWADELYQNQDESIVFNQTLGMELKTLMWLKEHFDLPVFVIGDGYGSYITQKLIQDCKLCSAGVCMAGGGRHNKLTLMFAMVLSWMGKKLFGKQACPTFTNRHKCRTYDYWFNLFKNLQTIRYDILPNIPLLIISGEQNLNNMNGRLARALYNAYSKHDLHNLVLIIYPDAEKDLLMMADRSDVQQDILDFITTQNISK